MKSILNVQLVIVDPQVDFCTPGMALPVAGADKDMERLALMIDRVGPKLNDIHVTLDSHRLVDISHPIWWKRVGDGQPPSPFTLLGLDGDRIVKLDPKTLAPTGEEYTTYMPSYLKRSREYLKAIATGKRYLHCIWPPHCLIGTPGHNVHPALIPALQKWESNFATVGHVTKGSNIWTEHFSAVKAEVPDPADPTTQINAGFIQTLETADMVLVAGEARSHCVACTVRDTVSSFTDPKYAEKLILLSDCMSDVPGFEALGEAFIKEMKSLGARVSTSVDCLA